MSFESSAFYIADLQATNPPSTDPTNQGDDHIRLIKQVLQNTLAGASRQFQIPGAIAISTSTAVTKANGESILYVSTTGGAVTLTLPALVALDAGWKVRIVKTSSDVNPVFIAPPSGTINSGGVAGLAKARRCIPGVQSTVVWDGAAWFVTRVHALPIGSCIEFHGSALPAGFEWPNGQTLASVATNYPEYNAAMGGGATLDKRGRIGVALDNLGGAAAGRLGGGFITGTVVGNVGGVDGVTLGTAQIPAHQHGVFVKVTDPQHSHTFLGQFGGAGTGTTPLAGVNTSFNTTTNASSTGITVGIGSVSGVANDNQTAANTGGGGSHSNLQPSIMVSQILVVE